MQTIFLTACAMLAASAALGQGAGTGSATLGGEPCAETVAGYSVDEMIASAGGTETLYGLSVAQIAEYDRWLVELEQVMDQGVREADLRDLYAQGVAAREIELLLKDALECRLGL